MKKEISKAHGFSLLELLVVIGIMGVLGGFVYPSINDWQKNKNIERDLQAYTSLLDYVSSKAKAVGGTGMVYCEIHDENTTIVSYKISRHFLKPNAADTFNIDANFTNNIIKDPRNAIGSSPAEDPNHNILSGKSDFEATICQVSGIINARGQSGLNGVVRTLRSIDAYIHVKGASASLVGATLSGDDEYDDHPSYFVKLTKDFGLFRVNRRDYSSGSWECAEDWYSDVKGDGNAC
tara:strand:- start:1002 stop:1709 length:708 start_codon:yes stop_codon:yes gene_type:complete